MHRQQDSDYKKERGGVGEAEESKWQISDEGRRMSLGVNTQYNT